MTKPGRGGRRKGAGRPPLPPSERKTSHSFRLSEEDVAKLEATGNGWESWRDVLRRLIAEATHAPGQREAR